MGALYRDFEQTLEEWNRRFAGKRREEMIHLFLLALEREEIVAVSYRENAIAQRLAAMPVGGDVRELIRHALIWIWKDEEMHSIYIRGAILRFGNFRLKTTAYLRQLAGGVGGRSSSVLMHARWRDAPPLACLPSRSVDFLKRTGRTAEHGDDTAARLRPQRAAERLLH